MSALLLFSEPARPSESFLPPSLTDSAVFTLSTRKTKPDPLPSLTTLWVPVRSSVRSPPLQQIYVQVSRPVTPPGPQPPTDPYASADRTSSRHMTVKRRAVTSTNPASSASMDTAMQPMASKNSTASVEVLVYDFKNSCTELKAERTTRIGELIQRYADKTGLNAGTLRYNSRMWLKLTMQLPRHLWKEIPSRDTLGLHRRALLPFHELLCQEQR